MVLEFNEEHLQTAIRRTDIDLHITLTMLQSKPSIYNTTEGSCGYGFLPNSWIALSYSDVQKRIVGKTLLVHLIVS